MAAPGESYRPAFPSSSKPYISTGLPFQVACAHHVKTTFHSTKAYIIVSNSISKTENFTKLQDVLDGTVVGVRKGIRPHTPWDDILEIVKDVKEKDADLIITLGAGSLTDGAKVISLVRDFPHLLLLLPSCPSPFVNSGKETYTSEKERERENPAKPVYLIYVKLIIFTQAVANNATTHEGLTNISTLSQNDSLQPCKIPIINIPTSLSGGEYSSFAGATDTRTGHKVGFRHSTLGAQLIILDPALTLTTPKPTWFASGIRAVDHCVEGLCSLNEKVSNESDAAFTQGLKLLVPSLLQTKENWDAQEPRLNEMLGVLEAMKGLMNGIPMGASHGIGHQLGPLGVGHGETSCVMLPAVLKYTAQHGDSKVRSAQQKVLDFFWSDEVVAAVLQKRGLEKKSADAGDVVDAVVRELGLPRSLKDVGVKKDQFDALSDNCLKDHALKTNAVPILQKEQVLDILEMAAQVPDNCELRG